MVEGGGFGKKAVAIGLVGRMVPGLVGLMDAYDVALQARHQTPAVLLKVRGTFVTGGHSSRDAAQR